MPASLYGYDLASDWYDTTTSYYVDDWSNRWYRHGRDEVSPITDPETNAYLGSVRRPRRYVRVPRVSPLTVGTASTVAVNTSTVSFSTAFETSVTATNTWRAYAHSLINGWAAEWRTTSYGTVTPVAPKTAEELARERRRLVRAKAKAKRLLAAHLPDAELERLEESGYFEVTSLTTGRVYRVYRGYSRNVVRLDEAGVPVERLCAHIGLTGVPDEDHMLAQRLYLQTQEEEFRRVANISRIGKVEARNLLADHQVEHVDHLPTVTLPLAA